MTEATTRGQFRKYDHLERLGHPEVRDLDLGTIHVFPKLDGTNASVWFDGEHVQCGSRNRVLSADADNHGFHAYVHGSSPEALALRMLVMGAPDIVVYGEWLVPHSLKTYRDDAWRRFWIFDVFNHDTGGYMPYESYGESFKAMGLDVITPLCTADNPSRTQLDKMLAANTFLVQDGAGSGEGIVLKNYAWRNQFGRQPWAKIVTTEFREKNTDAFGVRHIKGERDICAEIANELVTKAFAEKEYAKVVGLVATDKGVDLELDPDPDAFVAANRHKIIPRFLGTAYYELVREDIHTMLKKWRNPVIDFGRLQKLVTLRLKAHLPDVF